MLYTCHGMGLFQGRCSIRQLGCYVFQCLSSQRIAPDLLVPSVQVGHVSVRRFLTLACSPNSSLCDVHSVCRFGNLAFCCLHLGSCLSDCRLAVVQTGMSRRRISLGLIMLLIQGSKALGPLSPYQMDPWGSVRDLDSLDFWWLIRQMRLNLIIHVRHSLIRCCRRCFERRDLRLGIG
jgi:hypothetical protein